MAVTSRWALRYPLAADDAKPHTDLQNLATDCDTFAKDDQGPIASRPVSTPGTPGKFGRYYFATDEGRLYRDFGTGWTEIGPAAAIPPGTVQQYAGVAGPLVTNAPAGYLLCMGGEASRTTYAALYTALGGAASPYGQGNGSTTFNVPNFKGRGPVGVDTAQSEFNSLGELGGSKTHPLAVAEMPLHSHQVNAHSHGGITGGMSANNPHTHQGHTNALVATGGFLYTAGDVVGNFEPINAHTGNVVGTNIEHGHGIASESPGTNNAGTGPPATGHNNLQPYLALHFIIKI